MQAILTKYKGPTNARGSRVYAICEGGSITLPWDDALNSDDNHRAAAEALNVKIGRTGRTLIAGGMPTSSPFAYAFVELPS